VTARPGGDYGTIVVVGGGCYGSYYVRQLGRANRAGAVRWKRILVVDRDPGCLAARSGELDSSLFESAAPQLQVAVWEEFFEGYLSRWATDDTSSLSDAVVPSPLMPHLMYQWVRDRAATRWPSRQVRTVPLPGPPATPWQSAAPDGTHYLSFATWMCPVNCVEPERCPHTRGPRSWTMPETIEEYVGAQRREGRRIDGPVIFHCTHRAYGVGMIDTASVVAGDDLVRLAGERGPVNVLIGTVSHCHGALNLLSVG